MNFQKITSACFLLIINFKVFAQKQIIENSSIKKPFIPGYYTNPTILVKYCHNQKLNLPTKALCTRPTSNDSKVWASSIKKDADGKFHMFVSVGSEVYQGITDHPKGPWENVKVDGSPFLQWKGNYYIVYHCIIETKMPRLHRELRIDKTSFDAVGNINVVHPTN